MDIMLGAGIVSAVAGVIAAGAAIWSTRQSQKQFKRNMQVQERAINLSLFDARVEILDQIKKNDFSFSLERAKFLFNQDIIKLLNEYIKKGKERNDLSFIRKQYIDCVNEAAATNSWEDVEESRDFQKVMLRYLHMDPGVNCTEQEYMSTRELMRQHPITFKPDGPGCDWVTYSLGDIDTEIENRFREQESMRTNLINKIREYIQASIADTPGSSKQRVNLIDKIKSCLLFIRQHVLTPISDTAGSSNQ